MTDRPDQILVEQIQAGYSDAFGLLAKKYQHKVYQMAYHFTHNADGALRSIARNFSEGLPFPT